LLIVAVAAPITAATAGEPHAATLFERLSSIGQGLDVQLDKLKHCDKIYQEKKVGLWVNAPNSKRAWIM
jgi:hypothetical protein